MRWKAKIAVIGFALLALAASAYAAPVTITVDQALDNSAIYEGKPVRVHGFATFEFENNRLWRDEAAFRNYERDRALYIAYEPTLITQPMRDEAKGRLAYIEGTFRGHDFSPALIDIISVQRDPTDHGPDRGWWSDPDFTTLLMVLSALSVVIVGLIFGLKGQGLLSQQEWKPRKAKI